MMHVAPQPRSRFWVLPSCMGPSQESSVAHLSPSYIVLLCKQAYLCNKSASAHTLHIGRIVAVGIFFSTSMELMS